MIVYGEAIKPRVVAFGFDRSHPFALVVEKYAGSVTYLCEDSDIRWASYDAVVALGDPGLDDDHLRLLQIGGDPDGRHSISSTTTYGQPVRIAQNKGDEVVLPDGLEPNLRELVKRDLYPLVVASIARSGFPYRIAPWGMASPSKSDGKFERLLHDLDSYSFAAIYRPPRGLFECIYLPDLVTDLAPWLVYAFKRWSADLPDIFPSEPEWISNPMWMTNREQEAAVALDEVRPEAAFVLEEQDALIREAEQRLVEARDSSSDLERSLITAEGDLLVDAVERALLEIGFSVRNMDAELEEGQARREDLRVSNGEWTALCEVKGYSKGAKGGDLTLFGKWSPIYTKETGRLPDALWYTVNQFRNVDPSSRPQPLTGADDFVETFAESPGLVVDTRDLFLLHRAVVAGSVSRDAAMQLLINSTGRLDVGPTVGA